MNGWETIAAQAMQRSLQMSGGELLTPTTLTQKVDAMNALNATPGALPDSLLAGVDCPVCRNKGYVIATKDGCITAQECDCMKRRRTLRRMRKSGLMDLLQVYTLDKYQVREPWQEYIKKSAIRYLSAPCGKWFVITGTPGSGKTHICTAIVSELIKRGMEAQYMLWREDAPRLKALVNEREEYEQRMKSYKTVDVLYIDDFFKGEKPTAADVNLAFELLNARYNARNLITLISCERKVGELMDIDEAVGSRIYERSKDFQLVTKDGANWRLKGR